MNLDAWKVTQPVLTPAQDRKTMKPQKGIMEFARVFKYAVQTHKGMLLRTIQPQSIYDGASIPKLFWPIIGHPFSAQFWRAAAMHDDLYGLRHNRSEADYIFREELLKAGVSALKAWTMWVGVRAGGWVCYIDRNKWYNNLAYKVVMGWDHKPRPWYGHTEAIL